MGVEANSTRPTETALLTELHRVADRAAVDGTPTRAEIDKHGRYSSHHYDRLFGSYTMAVIAAGYEPNNCHALPDDLLLDVLEALADDLGRTPTQTEMDDHGLFSHGVYQNRWGSWNEAVVAAGLEPQRARGPGTTIPKSKLLDELHRLAADLDEAPTIGQMDTVGQFSSSIYTARWGSWTEALQAAGLTPKREQNISEERLLEDLRRVAEALGKRPSVPDVDDHGRYSSSTYYRRWGSWEATLSAAGL